VAALLLSVLLKKRTTASYVLFVVVYYCHYSVDWHMSDESLMCWCALVHCSCYCCDAFSPRSTWQFKCLLKR